jgi:drug/metabolite transporter (DMT)-like permease
MDINIFAAVMLAAVLHSTWNGMVKKHKDKVISVSAIVFGHVPMALVVMLFMPLPTLESVPYIILSAIIHQGYQVYLISAYKFGDLTKVYPVARGTGPIVATLISILVLGVVFSKFQIISIILISFGIIILGLLSKNSQNSNKTLIYSLATGFFIGIYSLTDGYGARISLSPLSFLGWSFILNAMIFPFTLKLMNYSNVFSRVIKEAKLVFWVGGTLSYVVYAIVVWAFTKAPIPLVGALRESGIIFSIIIGIFFLNEKISINKVISIILIFLGVVGLKIF